MDNRIYNMFMFTVLGLFKCVVKLLHRTKRTSVGSTSSQCTQTWAQCLVCMSLHPGLDSVHSKPFCLGPEKCLQPIWPVDVLWGRKRLCVSDRGIVSLWCMWEMRNLLSLQKCVVFYILILFREIFVKNALHLMSQICTNVEYCFGKDYNYKRMLIFESNASNETCWFRVTSAWLRGHLEWTHPR